MLQLLLEGGQGYDDIGSLLGIPPDQVRSRARDALREMGGADPDAQVQLSDFLLGQADPIGRADAVRHLQNDPEANALASRLLTQLRLIAPQAELPEIPAPKGGRRAAAHGRGAGARAPRLLRRARPAPARESAAGRAHAARCAARGSSKRGNQMIAIGVAVAGAAAGRGPRDRGRLRRRRGDGGGARDRDHRDGRRHRDLTIVRLSPLERRLRAAAARRSSRRPRTSPCCRSTSPGWQPTSEDNIYIVWLYNSDRAAFPLARDQVAENGNLTGAAAIPNEIIPLLAQFGCIDVSLASTAGDAARRCSRPSTARACPRHTRRDGPARPDPDAGRRRRRRPAPTRSATVAPPEGGAARQGRAAAPSRAEREAVPCS